MKAWVYIVECSDGLYYTSSTTNLEQRISDHNTGRFEGFTSLRLPVKLIWFEEFKDIRDAIVLERQIKGWSRKKKEALMSPDINSLRKLSRSTYSKTKTHSSTRSLTLPRSE
jgi:putative endonuclease